MVLMRYPRPAAESRQERRRLWIPIEREAPLSAAMAATISQAPSRASTVQTFGTDGMRIGAVGACQIMHTETMKRDEEKVDVRKEPATSVGGYLSSRSIEQ